MVKLGYLVFFSSPEIKLQSGEAYPLKLWSSELAPAGTEGQVREGADEYGKGMTACYLYACIKGHSHQNAILHLDKVTLARALDGLNLLHVGGLKRSNLATRCVGTYLLNA